MTREGGFVKIYRQLKSWEWYDDVPVCKLFLHLLLTVNRFPQDWRGEIVNPGECVTSFGHLAIDSGLSVQQVRTALKKLESTGEVKVTATNKYTKVKVCNFNDYQGSNVDKQQTNNKQTTNKQQTNNNQITTNKKGEKGEKGEKDKNTTKESARDFAKKMPAELQPVLEEFITFREKAKKPLTAYALKLALNKAKRYAEDDINVVADILNQSIENGWTGIYPIKDNKPKESVSFMDL